MKDDDPRLIRTEFSNLESEKWWRSLQIDALIFYGWGDPKYQAIMTAIRAAGIKLIQNLDTVGIYSPYSNFPDWFAASIGLVNRDQSLKGNFRLCARMIRDFFPKIYETKRLAAIDQSDLVFCVSNAARFSICDYASSLGLENITAKARVIPHAVNPVMKFTTQTKTNTVLMVGRWEKADESQKDPRMMLKCLKVFLTSHSTWNAVIVGRGATELDRFCKQWSPELRERLQLLPHLAHDSLVSLCCESKILFCASRFESFHIASGEAVCCGCSVVVAAHPLLRSTEHFTSQSSGTVAIRRDHRSLVQALESEAEAWEHGARNPAQISKNWSSQLHAPNVARAAMKIITDPPAA